MIVFLNNQLTKNIYIKTITKIKYHRTVNGYIHIPKNIAKKYHPYNFLLQKYDCQEWTEEFVKAILKLHRFHTNY